MDHGIDLPRIAGQKIHQCLRRDHVFQLAFGDIAPLVTGLQPVADHKPRMSVLGQLSQDIGADEAGAAGNNNHGSLAYL